MDEQTQQAPAGPPQDDLRSLLRGSPNGGRSKSTMLLAAVALVAIGVIGGLFVGKNLGNDSQQLAFPRGQNGPGLPSGNAGDGGGFPAGDVTIGTIKSIDGDTITLEAANGDTLTVKIASDTQIQITEDGSVSDLGARDTVVVSGEQNDGTIDASSISEGGAGIPLGPGANGSN